MHLKRIIIISLIISIFFVFPVFQPIERTNSFIPSIKSSSSTLLIVGILGDPDYLDPHRAWDQDSFAVQQQVVEGLFTYNLSDPNSEIIPHLAADYGTWSPDGRNYTVTLKTGIEFHDGTPFNADAVIFSFNRLKYFMDMGWTLPTELYQYYSVSTDTYEDIIDDVVKINDNTIEFELNVVYAPFEALLCFMASSILSPTSTPATSIIDTNTGDLVGTGPFVYDSYVENDEINFHAFTNYWGGAANFTFLHYEIITDKTDRTNALLNGEVDLILNPEPSLFSALEADPNCNVQRVLSNQPDYLGMNNYWINTTFRQAISYAINYSFIIDEIVPEGGVRLESPISEGVYYSNYSYKNAIFNISKAREIMQTMGYGVGWDTTYGGIDEANWQSATFAIFNYTYNPENQYREDILQLLQNNLDLIGITIEAVSTGFANLIYSLYEVAGRFRDQVQLFALAWILDYNDPSNIINNVFTNRSIFSNGIKYDGYLSAKEMGRDPYDLYDNVQLLMEEALFTHNKVDRASYYNRIQELLVEEDMPWVYLCTRYSYIACRAEVSGLRWNNMRILWLHDVKTPLKADRINPVVTINQPSSMQLFSTTPPQFNILIVESNFSYSWYSIYNGITWSDLTFFSGTTGSIDATIWNSIANGTVVIRFYANDTSDNLAFDEVTVQKDIIAPDITINSPIALTEFKDSPNFSLSILEGNLDSIWYSLDNGAYNYTCSLTGQIDTSLWATLALTTHTICFYANDTLGNIGYATVTIEKTTIDLPPAIPGYITGYLFFIVGGSILLGIIVYSKKIRFKF